MDPYPFDPELNLFRTKSGICFLLETPDLTEYGDGQQEALAAQKNYISGYMQRVEDAIYGENFTDASGTSYRDLWFPGSGYTLDSEIASMKAMLQLRREGIASSIGENLTRVYPEETEAETRRNAQTAEQTVPGTPSGETEETEETAVSPAGPGQNRTGRGGALPVLLFVFICAGLAAGVFFLRGRTRRTPAEEEKHEGNIGT